MLTVGNSLNQKSLYDTTPLPESIPKVKELGASSAPLLSASFFIGARCKDYNDDYMQCKNENPGRGEFECLKEGRRVTRCARSVYVLCAPDTERVEEPVLITA
jgi:NADH dehydrogenase (ubiquinone) 1 alpha subcomplex subunit 8